MKHKSLRANFRKAVFERDNYTCQICGRNYKSEEAEEYLDAHHITNRKNFVNGGYVKENGISLCKHGERSCHWKAETWNMFDFGIEGLSPIDLYQKICSSLLIARERDLDNG